METRQVSAIWAGLDRNIVTILAMPAPRPYGDDVSDHDDRVILYRREDERGEATGDIIGIEIEDFADFDHWAALPTLSERWQLADWEPLPLVELLKRLQVRLVTPTPVSAAAHHS